MGRETDMRSWNATAALAAAISLLLASSAPAAPELLVEVFDTSAPNGIFIDSADGFEAAASALVNLTPGASLQQGGVGTAGQVQLQFGVDTDSCRLSTCIGGFTGTSSNQDLSYTAEILVRVTPQMLGPSDTWEISFGGNLEGNIQVLGDGGGGSGFVSITSSNWSVSGATLTNTSFGAGGSINAPGINGNQFFSDSGSTVVSGVGAGIVELRLANDVFVESLPGGLLINNGEDACARFGIDVGNLSGAPAEVLCPEYPGLGLADPATHGLFLDYDVTALNTIPEPGTALLLGMGTSGLAALGRRKAGRRKAGRRKTGRRKAGRRKTGRRRIGRRRRHGR